AAGRQRVPGRTTQQLTATAANMEAKNIGIAHLSIAWSRATLFSSGLPLSVAADTKPATRQQRTKNTKVNTPARSEGHTKRFIGRFPLLCRILRHSINSPRLSRAGQSADNS